EDPTMPWGRSIVVEAAREGFDVEVVRRVTERDQPEPRVLTLKSSYQPSHTVTLYGTLGRPAGAPLPVAAPAAAATPATNRPAGAANAPAGDATPAPLPPTPQPIAPTPTPAAPRGPTPVPAPAKPKPRAG